MLVIGIGNDHRGDDAAGLAVVRRLRGLDPAITVVEAGDPSRLAELWAGHDQVVLVDAGRSGRAPGTVRRIDGRRASLALSPASAGTHGVGVAEAIGLAASIGRTPDTLVVWTVEGARFEPGAPMCDEVAQRLDEVALRILVEARLAAASPRPVRREG